MKFNALDLNEITLNALDSLGYLEATEIQEKAIPVILSGADIVARSQTGSGKTLAFGLPIIEKLNFDIANTQSLIVCPTRELAMQVCDEIKKITVRYEGISVVPVYGGANIARQILSLKKRPKIVVGTPGRILDHLNRRTLKLHDITTVVLDEADEMLNMGFKEDIEKILKSTPSQRQTLMFSATFPASIMAITKDYQREPVFIEIGEQNKSLENMSLKFIRTERNGKQIALVNLLDDYKPNLSIVFCNTKKMTEVLKAMLTDAGFNALCLNGDMRQRERTNVMRDIKSARGAMILVATDVAARGIDISDVDIVFNFDLPNNTEYFLHRIGRTARAGKSGQAITIINTKEQVKLLAQFEKETKSNIVEIGNTGKNDKYSDGNKKPPRNKPAKNKFVKNKPTDGETVVSEPKEPKLPFNKFRSSKQDRQEKFAKAFDDESERPFKKKFNDSTDKPFKKKFADNKKSGFKKPYDKNAGRDPVNSDKPKTDGKKRDFKKYDKNAKWDTNVQRTKSDRPAQKSAPFKNNGGKKPTRTKSRY